MTSAEAWNACAELLSTRGGGGKADYTVDQLRKLSGRLIFMNKNYSPIPSLRKGFDEIYITLLTASGIDVAMDIASQYNSTK